MYNETEITESVQKRWLKEEELARTLSLRPFSQYWPNVDDRTRRDIITDYTSWFNDQEVTRHLWLTLPRTEDAVREWIDNTAKDPNSPYFFIKPYWWARPIGHTGIRMRESSPIATSSIVIGEKKYWNLGIGEDVLWRVMTCVVFPERIQQLRAHILDDNHASKRVYIKNGFITLGEIDLEGENSGLVFRRSAPRNLFEPRSINERDPCDGSTSLCTPLPMFQIK